jgi:hypothetical protein
MISLNQKIEQQFSKYFLFEFTAEKTKIQLNFPLQFDNRESLFPHLTRSYSLIQLNDIIMIETSSDNEPLNYLKENVLHWETPNWVPKIY